MRGIGIDTGGTCTDVVIYDTEQGRVLASAKDQTTRPDLKTGILKALRQIPEALRPQADYVALSTTLATNACVEGKGGRAGLILIGAHPKVVARNGPAYGLPPLSQLCLLPGRAGAPLPSSRSTRTRTAARWSGRRRRSLPVNWASPVFWGTLCFRNATSFAGGPAPCSTPGSSLSCRSFWRPSRPL